VIWNSEAAATGLVVHLPPARVLGNVRVAPHRREKQIGPPPRPLDDGCDVVHDINSLQLQKHIHGTHTARWRSGEQTSCSLPPPLFCRHQRFLSLFPYPPPAAPPEACGFTLSRARPCIDFLTDLTIQAPTQNCCDRLASILNNSSTRICLCHMLRSDVNHYTGAAAPINLERAILLPATCTIVPPIDTFYMCFGKLWKVQFLV
jgi:hypothetical protein